MKRILIVKMWALGDILMATPLLRALKAGYPDCRIDWFVEAAQAQILENSPFIDDVIAFDSALWRRQFRYGHIIAYLRTSIAMRRMLVRRDYDVVINLTAEKWWSVWFTVAPRRIGLFPRANAGLIGRLYTDVIERSPKLSLHNTQHYLLPAKALGFPGPYDERMVVGVSDAQRSIVDALLRSSPSYSANRPLIVLHPGTSQAAKCWTPEQFASLASRLTGHNIAITGSPGERELAERIASMAGRDVVIAAGALQGIGETAALIERASAVVTGDTSALHIASALDIPLVGIYGSTRPRDNAPLFGRSELLFDDTPACAPCYRPSCRLADGDKLMCLRMVTVEQVLAALERLGVETTRAAADGSSIGSSRPSAREARTRMVNQTL